MTSLAGYPYGAAPSRRFPSDLDVSTSLFLISRGRQDPTDDEGIDKVDLIISHGAGAVEGHDERAV